MSRKRAEIKEGSSMRNRVRKMISVLLIAVFLIARYRTQSWHWA